MANELFYIFNWWLILSLLGITAVPITRWIFARLTDQGYAFSKMVGILFTSYFFWLFATLGIVDNTTGGIVIGLLVLVGLSAWAERQFEVSSWRWANAHLRQIGITELIFLLLFGAWTWVRAQNPAITATEKPMEFAFLNSAYSSPNYPPLDPWLSGFTISYYYFGYIFMSVVGRLAGVPAAYAFNLGIAWLVAGSGIGAFGFIYNVTAYVSSGSGKRHAANIALVMGMIGALAIPLGGNAQIILELLHGNGIGGEQVWTWVDIRDINGPTRETPRFLVSDGSPNASWWWWRSSRVIHEYYLSGQAEEGFEPIAEFPGFSFVLGDMHPHVLALPLVFVLLGLSFTWYLIASDAIAGRRRGDDDEEAAELGGWESIQAWGRSLLEQFGAIRLVLSALLVGGLAFTNTWDVPIHLFVLVGAYALGRWRTERWSPARLTEGVILGLSMGAAAYLLYWPFFMALSSQAGAPYIMPMLMWPTRMIHFLVIFGPFLLLGVTLLATLTTRATLTRSDLIKGGAFGFGLFGFLLFFSLFLTFILAAAQASFPLLGNIAFDLEMVFAPRTPGTFDFGYGQAFMGQLLPSYLVARVQALGMTLFLALMLSLIVALWHALLRVEFDHVRPSGLPFILLLLLTGAMLTLGPEFLYVKDNFGLRLNTIFKFYYQAWILFGTAGLIGLGYLVASTRVTGRVLFAGYAVIFALVMVFPFAGVLSRSVEYRGSIGSETRQSATLNGLSFIERQNRFDYEAIGWVQAETAPESVILETTGGAYSYYSRVSANTGRSTVLGWANHEFQWRGDSTPEPGLRTERIYEIYNTTDWGRAQQLLNDYDIDYIYVGSLERDAHDEFGLLKFEENLEVAYRNDGVVIYRWE